MHQNYKDLGLQFGVGAQVSEDLIIELGDNFGNTYYSLLKIELFFPNSIGSHIEIELSNFLACRHRNTGRDFFNVTL